MTDNNEMIVNKGDCRLCANFTEFKKVKKMILGAGKCKLLPKNVIKDPMYLGCPECVPIELQNKFLQIVDILKEKYLSMDDILLFFDTAKETAKNIEVVKPEGKK